MATGKVPGSINIPLAEFLARADPGSPDHEPALQPEKTVILYCASGKRSQFAGNKLLELGYREVFNLGGLKDWELAGLPVDDGDGLGVVRPLLPSTASPNLTTHRRRSMAPGSPSENETLMSEDPAAPPAARMPHGEFVAMVAFLMALNAMAIDVILPALQQMGESLAVADENTRQLPLTAYVAFFGVSQLVYGTLSDRFGRRPVLLFGLVVYVAGGIGAAVAGDFTMLLAMRGIQGIGAGATRVIAISIVRDTFGGRRMASVMSLAMMVFMAVPIIAPTIGQGIMMFAAGARSLSRSRPSGWR